MGQFEDLSDVNESTELRLGRTLIKIKSRRRHATERVNPTQEVMGDERIQAGREIMPQFRSAEEAGK